MKSIVENLQHKKKLTEDTIRVTRTRVDEGKNNLQSLLGKLLSFGQKSSSNQKINELEAKQKSIEQEIHSRKDEIQVLKGKIQNLGSSDISSTVYNP